MIRYRIPGDYYDFSAVTGLKDQERRSAEEMLLVGVESCDELAAEGIARLGARGLVPQLKDVLQQVGSPFDRLTSPLLVELINALAQLDPRPELSRYLLPLLRDSNDWVRQRAADIAGLFNEDQVRRALLERVRTDREFFVRFLAANSLLLIGDVYPRDVKEHEEIYVALLGKPGRGPFHSWGLFFDVGPTAEDKAHYERAAQGLERALAERAAQGACPAIPAKTAAIHNRVQYLNEKVAAVAVDVTDGSCGAMRIAIMAFISTPDGFDETEWIDVGRKDDPLTFYLSARSSKLALTYSRSSSSLRAGGADLAAGSNLLLLERGAGGVTVKWRGNVDLEVHNGRAVAEILARAPALKALLPP